MALFPEPLFDLTLSLCLHSAEVSEDLQSHSTKHSRPAHYVDLWPRRHCNRVHQARRHILWVKQCCVDSVYFSSLLFCVQLPICVTDIAIIDHATWPERKTHLAERLPCAPLLYTVLVIVPGEDWWSVVVRKGFRDTLGSWYGMLEKTQPFPANQQHRITTTTVMTCGNALHSMSMGPPGYLDIDKALISGE